MGRPMAVNITKLSAAWRLESLDAQRAEGKRLIALADAGEVVWPPRPTMEEQLAKLKVGWAEDDARKGGNQRAEFLRTKHEVRNREICSTYEDHRRSYPRQSREQCCRVTAAKLGPSIGRTLSTRQIRVILMKADVW